MRILLLIILLCLLYPGWIFSEDTSSWESPFGLDYVYPYYREYQNPVLPRIFAEAGIKWVNFADVGWRNIEPLPPRKGMHRYRWKTLDRMVKLWQSYGFHISITLKCNAEWAGGKITRPPLLLSSKPGLKKRWEKKVDKLPSPEHIQDYRDYIRALVERYDGDGKEDMPGLRFPILHYQIGNEYVHEGYWGGTVEDYGKLLEVTYKAAKSAHPQVKIILAGITWNDLFYNDIEGKNFDKEIRKKLDSEDALVRKGWEEAVRFTLGELKFWKWYDIVDARGNGPFPHAFPGYIRWLERELDKLPRKKEIWDMESRCEPQFTYHELVNFHPHIFASEGWEIISRMKKVPYEERENNSLWRWYYREQASQLVKVIATRLGSGVKKVFVGYPLDWDVNPISALAAQTMKIAPWIGFVDKKYRPKPALSAYRKVISLISGFRKVEPLINVKEGIWHYVFILPDKKVHILWYNDDRANSPYIPYGKKKVSISLSSGKATLIPVVTGLSEKSAEIKELRGKRIQLTLSEIPVSLEEESL